MKNKKKIYVLLFAVILIWGILGYKILKGLNPLTSTNSKANTNREFYPKSIKQIHSYKLIANYRDPFLGKLVQKLAANTTKTKPSPSQLPATPFPAIVYKGLIAPANKEEQVFLISIEGQQFFFKKNTTYNGVQLLKGNAQEVVLQFQNHRKSFPFEK